MNAKDELAALEAIQMADTDAKTAQALQQRFPEAFNQVYNSLEDFDRDRFSEFISYLTPEQRKALRDETKQYLIVTGQL